MPKPILFYSKKNPRCINLWNQLSKENQLASFIKICVDNNPKIPPMIKSVPCIYIKGRPLICDSAIPMYLNSLLANNQPNINNTEHSVPSGTPQQTPTASSEQINDFNPVEMSKRWSDSYSFISDDPAPLSFSFQFLNDNPVSQSINQQSPQQTSQQPLSVPQVPQSRNKSGEFQERLEKLQQSRIDFK
tara:strand:- start:7785 stop:8351 length:567 start_codon:yes stop_codon:yes gene_type:complete